MSGISKRVSGSWVSGDYGIMKTDTDTITTLPADIYANDTTATVGLKGQATQSGTPSPTTPIQPQETGERTAQLIPFPYYSSSGTYNGVPFTVSTDGKITASGTTVGGANFSLTRALALTVGTYTASIMGNHNGMALLIYDATNNRLLGSIPSSKSKITFDVDNNNLDIRVYFNTGGVSTLDIDCYVMINTGSTPLPYEKFGYKIPISSANTTTPVYLGEVETTRKIKKYEFTGQESIVADLTYSRFSFTLNDSLIIGVRKTPAFCTHWQVIDDGRPIANVPNNALYSDSAVNSRWFIKTTDYTTVDDFKAYLAQQYAAGTPVTVWYVLATPETAVVNEPLMKIGDYADEVANISIPVTAGGDTISVDTTLQPSEVTVNYKGWHPVADIHERDNGVWT